jgi:hypothetical protein
MASKIEIDQLIQRVEAIRHHAQSARQAAEMAASQAAEARREAETAYAEADLVSQALANIAQGKVGLSIPDGDDEGGAS